MKIPEKKKPLAAEMIGVPVVLFMLGGLFIASQVGSMALAILILYSGITIRDIFYMRAGIHDGIEVLRNQIFMVLFLVLATLMVNIVRNSQGLRKGLLALSFVFSTLLLALAINYLIPRRKS